MERALEVGFLGGESLETQIAHAWGFVACVETFLAQECESDSELGIASGEYPTTKSLGPARFLDLGSGGGLPGLVLAHHWQQSEVVLLDGNLRKTAALREAVNACGWANRVGVVHSRAEVAARSGLRGVFDLVVSRSFGPPPVTAECAAAFLRPGGLLVVSEPPAHFIPVTGTGMCASNPGRWPSEGLVVVGLEPVAAWRRRFGYQVLRQAASCPKRFPRREGIPRKRPIYRLPETGTGRSDE
ncbi:MAG: RsmG family class I SAM-dependent methyltransferase [Acidimicrobiales bacterium]